MAALVLWGGAAGPARAQDVEVLSELTGIPLPAAYFDAVRDDPNAFELPNGLFRMTAGGPVPASAVVEGAVRIPVVLALFADSPDPHIQPAAVQTALFDGPAPAGTLTDLYLEMSSGRLRVTGDVLPWVRTSTTLLEGVADSHGLGGASSLGDYLMQALDLVDPFVDFSEYDSTGDGVVDVVAFEFIEVAASCGGPGVWPHRSSIAWWNDGEPYATDDLDGEGNSIVINGYIIQSVVACSGETVQDAAVFAHEFGHVLGLPDFYHPVGPGPENRRWVLGCWELMAAGAWGCGPVGPRVPFGPTHMMAPQKARLGWVELVEVGEVWDEELVLEPVQTSGRAFKVPLDPEGIEALILEYRPQIGFDASLPAGGVLISHQDLLGSLRPPAGRRYRMGLVEADANRGLVRTFFEGGNRGEAGDAWGVGGNTGPLNALTKPAVLRNATGGAATVAIHSIAVGDGEARVRLSTGRTPRVMPPAGPVEASLASRPPGTLRIAGGLMPYTVIEVSGGPPGLAAAAAGDALSFVGAPGEMGAYEMVIRLGDAAGGGFEVVVPVTVGQFFVSEARLLQPFLRTAHEPLGPEERAHLDALGNQNGAFDVGDLRATLLGG